MTRYWATYERVRLAPYVRSAIVTLTDASTGEWAGSQRVDVRRGHSVYEAAYNAASASAIGKGGQLDRFVKSSE